MAPLLTTAHAQDANPVRALAGNAGRLSVSWGGSFAALHSIGFVQPSLGGSLNYVSQDPVGRKLPLSSAEAVT